MDRHHHRLFVMDEVAARSVGTEPGRVVGTTAIRLVLGMALDVSKLLRPVGELTLLLVFAEARLLERPTQLRLVALALSRLRRRRQPDVS